MCDKVLRTSQCICVIQRMEVEYEVRNVTDIYSQKEGIETEERKSLTRCMFDVCK